jgi:hypothetical protein
MQNPTSQTQSSRSTLILIALALSLFFSAGAVVKSFFFTPRIAYVNTSKLMIGSSEASKPLGL